MEQAAYVGVLSVFVARWGVPSDCVVCKHGGARVRFHAGVCRGRYSPLAPLQPIGCPRRGGGL